MSLRTSNQILQCMGKNALTIDQLSYTYLEYMFSFRAIFLSVSVSKSVRQRCYRMEPTGKSNIVGLCYTKHLIHQVH